MNDNNEEAGDQMLKLIRRARDAANAEQWGLVRELMRQARTLARTLDRELK